MKTKDALQENEIKRQSIFGQNLNHLSYKGKFQKTVIIYFCSAMIDADVLNIQNTGTSLLYLLIL